MPPQAIPSEARMPGSNDAERTKKLLIHELLFIISPYFHLDSTLPGATAKEVAEDDTAIEGG
jgi:hypothetical protein